MDLRDSRPTDVGRERRRSLAVAGVFLALAALAAVDLVVDLKEGTTVRHTLIEGAIVLFGAAGAGLLTLRWSELRRREREAREQLASLAADLERSSLEAARWREEARDQLAGLGALIERQFGRWGLTPAEREVARLLLKGLSHREIAGARGVGEATARQQAATVYRKAGLGGRHDLAAFFLEDLLPPRDAE